MGHGPGPGALCPDTAQELVLFSRPAPPAPLATDEGTGQECSLIQMPAADASQLRSGPTSTRFHAGASQAGWEGDGGPGPGLFLVSQFPGFYTHFTKGQISGSGEVASRGAVC